MIFSAIEYQEISSLQVHKRKESCVFGQTQLSLFVGSKPNHFVQNTKATT